MSTPLERLALVKKNIKIAAEKSGRDPQSVTLVAVSKSQPASAITEIFPSGQADFGENYAQELIEKASLFKTVPIRWHFIGHLQRRKVKDVVQHIGLLHSLDSVPLAIEIESHAHKFNSHIPCLIQINLSGETTKSGIKPEALPAFLRDVAPFKHLEITGLMTLPPPTDHPEESRRYFRELKTLMAEINRLQIYPMQLKELSMGMSHDFDVAIEEGATLVRVGTSIFGERKKGDS